MGERDATFVESIRAAQVDHPVLGNREQPKRVHGSEFSIPHHLSLANFVNMTSPSAELASAIPESFAAYVNSLYDRTLSWADIAWLRSITKLPIVVKGILTGSYSARKQ